MINKKDQVYAAIKDITENVTDTFPKNFATLPAIQYCEEDNKVNQWANNREMSSYVRYKFDLWDNVSTSAMAVELDSRISGLGLKRIQCTDIDDPNGFKHKIMRYEGIIDMRTERVVHKN